MPPSEDENIGGVGAEAPSLAQISTTNDQPNEELRAPLMNNAVMSHVPDGNVIRRKLTGYVGFANLPQQWHRKSIKKGFNLNLMVVGESGLGKSTLISTLFGMNDLYPEKYADEYGPGGNVSRTVEIKSVEANLEENNVRLHLTVIDTPGFGDFVNNADSWKPIIQDIDQRFERYLEMENKINRSTINDERVHACLYFIQPTGHSLKPLDIEVMKALHKKVNLIPIIAKADTLTEEEVLLFKKRILDDIKYQGIEIFEPPRYENDDEETIADTEEIMSNVPFAIVGSTQTVQNARGETVRGREYPWGVIEVDNTDHCDFVKLRQLLIRNHLEELRERTANVLYESYRTSKLSEMGVQQDYSVFREINPALRQEEERAIHEARLAKMEADMKAVFQQKVSEKEQKLKRSEAELFAKHREMKNQLEKQRQELEEKRAKLEAGRGTEERKTRKPFSLR